MHPFFRRSSIIILWASLLLVPYSLFAWACYAGLCGGGANAEIGQRYGAFFAYFAFGYLLICLFSLLSYYFNSRLRRSGWLLILPYIALLPFIYVQFKVQQIETQYQQRVVAYYQPAPNDYVCAGGKFIRTTGNGFLYFEIKSESKVVGNYATLQSIAMELQKYNLTLQQCKNALGVVLSQ